VSKFVGKFRQNRNYNDDEGYSRDFTKNKKRKKEIYREMRKMKMRSLEDENYSGGYDTVESNK